MNDFRFGKAKKEEKTKRVEAEKEHNKQPQLSKIYDKPPNHEATRGDALEERVVRLESPTVCYFANSLYCI